jgi:hypothetical protein
MAVLSIGMTGLIAANGVVATQNHSAAKRARASAIARDLMASISRWAIDDTRLANTAAGNDAEVAAGGISATKSDGSGASAIFDRDFNTDGAAAYADPLKASELDFDKDGTPDYERFLRVAPLSGEFAGLWVVVTVRWVENGRYRSLSMFQAKYDPAMNRASIPGL